MKDYRLLYPLEAMKSLCLSVVQTHPEEVEKVDGQQLGELWLFANINILLGWSGVPSMEGPLKLEGSDLTGFSGLECPWTVNNVLSFINGTLFGLWHQNSAFPVFKHKPSYALTLLYNNPQDDWRNSYREILV